jgi:hypothetical protein
MGFDALITDLVTRAKGGDAETSIAVDAVRPLLLRFVFSITPSDRRYHRHQSG